MYSSVRVHHSICVKGVYHVCSVRTSPYSYYFIPILNHSNILPILSSVFFILSLHHHYHSFIVFLHFYLLANTQLNVLKVNFLNLSYYVIFKLIIKGIAFKSYKK